MGRTSNHLDDLAGAFARTTKAYWRWLACYCDVDPAGKKKKAKKMAETPLGFLRGSFYFWPQLLAAADPELRDAPCLLAVGDMHVENFGVWRDAEGRLVWGVNDFDDATRLPFASDLVRLAASATLVDARKLKLSRETIAETVIAAYADQLARQPDPFVLEKDHKDLRDLASADSDVAVKFWEKLERETVIDAAKIPSRAAELLLGALPSGARVVGTFAPLSGTGSLGRPRYTVLADFRGGYVAREIKAAAPSSANLDRTDIEDPTAEYRLLESTAIRVRDPFLLIEPRWTVRRLSPESHKIEMETLKRADDWLNLLRAMGGELANVHLGSAPTREPILNWMRKGGRDVLVGAALRAGTLVNGLYERHMADAA